jgi:hypothetical protein
MGEVLLQVKVIPQCRSLVLTFLKNTVHLMRFRNTADLTCFQNPDPPPMLHRVLKHTAQISGFARVPRS